MRLGLILAGIVLLGAGVWVALGNVHYNATRTQAQFGPIKVEASEQKPVPAPLGYAGIVIGGALILAGVLRKS